MGISDLFVSYNQVQAPSYLSQPTSNYSSDLSNEDSIYDNAQLFNQELYDRINNRPKSIFAGWNPIEKSLDVPDDRTPTGSQIVNFFMNKGLTKNQAKGIYGNIMQESGGKHNIVSRDGHNSYGLAQWTGTRKARLFSKYGTNPTVNQQLEYLWDELNSTEKNALNALRNTTTVADATKVFMQKFERPANWAANLKNRLKHANSVA